MECDLGNGGSSALSPSRVVAAVSLPPQNTHAQTDRDRETERRNTAQHITLHRQNTHTQTRHCPLKPPCSDVLCVAGRRGACRVCAESGVGNPTPDARTQRHRTTRGREQKGGVGSEEGEDSRERQRARAHTQHPTPNTHRPTGAMRIVRHAPAERIVDQAARAGVELEEGHGLHSCRILDAPHPAPSACDRATSSVSVSAAENRVLN
eukprot:1431544-Rhodomonas_salina.1